MTGPAGTDFAYWCPGAARFRALTGGLRVRVKGPGPLQGIVRRLPAAAAVSPAIRAEGRTLPAECSEGPRPFARDCASSPCRSSGTAGPPPRAEGRTLPAGAGHHQPALPQERHTVHDVGAGAAHARTDATASRAGDGWVGFLLLIKHFTGQLFKVISGTALHIVHWRRSGFVRSVRQASRRRRGCSALPRGTSTGPGSSDDFVQGMLQAATRTRS